MKCLSADKTFILQNHGRYNSTVIILLIDLACSNMLETRKGTISTRSRMVPILTCYSAIQFAHTSGNGKGQALRAILQSLTTGSLSSFLWTVPSHVPIYITFASC